MIDIKKIRKDNINYGAIKVYEWTVSVDMTDVESITDVFLHEKQLIDIFNNKYDILTAIIELVDPETREVLFRIQNKFYKTDVVDTENSICYASPVNLEEYITQLVFTKEPAGEITLDVKEIASGEDVLEQKKDECLAEIQEKTEQCKDQLEVKVDELIQTIPSDYSALNARVAALENNEDKYEWNMMIQAIRLGSGDIYRTGEKILVDWRDATNNVAYSAVEHNIVDHSDVVVKNDVSGEDQTIHGLTLEWHYTIPFELAFDPAEDMCEVGSNGMPAGSYYFKSNGAFANMQNNGYYKFTVDFDLQPGNRLRPVAGPDNTVLIKVYADGQSFSELYSLEATLTDSQGDGAIYLGFMASKTDQGDAATYLAHDEEHDIYLNHNHRIQYGYNRWKDSLYRQWLNAEGIGWWRPQNVFDRAPSNIATLQGFLTGYSDTFKQVLRPIKKVTYRNTVTDTDGYDVTYDRVFLKSMADTNVDGFSTQQNTNGLEGSGWEFYKALAAGQSNLNPNGTFKAYQTYSVLIKYALNAKTSAQHVFSSSAYRGYASYVLHVSASGIVRSYGHAYDGHRCLPACVIS